jgi:hypothetical protein
MWQRREIAMDLSPTIEVSKIKVPVWSTVRANAQRNRSIEAA